jgi:digeranylgeranylglycerophospholipid reductase
METASDVIVIGGGPCGSFAAYNLAKLGARVTVFEEHPEVGIPSHCAGHLSIRGLERLGQYPLPHGIVENTFCGATFYSPLGNKFSVRFPSPVTCVVNRALFDEYVARMAEDAGTRYNFDSRVKSLVMKKGFVKGVTVRRNGKTASFHARLVIDAEGISSRFLRQAGLTVLDRNMLVNAVQAEVENVEYVKTDTAEVFLGKDYAPSFYAWLIPKGDGRAKVGLAAKHGNPREFLRKLMLKHPVASKKLGKARILQTIFHPITLGGPISKAYANGFLAVGDVASQVKPTTGGGVVFGMTAAKLVAEVAWKALEENEFSAGYLSEYQRLCKESFGFDVKVMLRMRKALDAMSDKKLDEMIGLCTKLGLDKTLQSVKDIDFQGQSLLRVLRSPRMLGALGYFFYVYLSANL